MDVDVANRGMSVKSNLLISAVFGMIIACNQAYAADATMPIMLVGDWCYGSIENKTTHYTLRSWTDGGLCKKILSINPWTFYFDSWNCEPLQVRQKKDCAPSGCAFEVLVVARCQSGGPATNGTRKLFEFSRYKGNLYITEK